MSTGLKNNPHFYEPMSSAAREYVNVCQRENRSRIAQKVRLPFHFLILLKFPFHNFVCLSDLLQITFTIQLIKIYHYYQAFISHHEAL